MEDIWEKSKCYSNCKLEELRRKLHTCVPEDAMAITFGSYARREASLEFDIDYNVIGPHRNEEGTFMEAIENAVGTVVPIEPSKNGPFAKYIDKEGFLKNLGGENGNCSPCSVQTRIGSGFRAIVRRMASSGPIARRRPVSMTDRMSA